jgi:NUMOD4 motif/NUMOD1 domain
LPKQPIYKNKSLQNIKGEVWKEIPSTDGYYGISNMGRVKSFERMVYSDRSIKGRKMPERILSPDISTHYNKHADDYVVDLAVVFTFEKKRFKKTIKRLVYEAFVAPVKKESMKGRLVYPEDGNGYNCKAENLALATRSEIRLRGFQNNRYRAGYYYMSKEKQAATLKKIHLSNRKKINKYSVDGSLLASYPSITSAAKKNTVSISCVSLCVQKKIRVLKGFVFRHATDKYNGELKNWDRNGCIGVVQYSMGGKLLQTFASIKEAAHSQNIHPNGISNCAYKKTRHGGGFIWRFEGETYNGEYKDLLKKRKCIQLSTTGKKLQTFESIAAAVKLTGADFSGIKRVIDGERKTCKGYVWRYE